MQSCLESREDFVKRDNTSSKITFLSYYISLCISNIQQNSRSQCISVKEIYNFLQDLHSKLTFKFLQLQSEMLAIVLVSLIDRCM